MDTLDLENYKKEKRTVDLVWANIFALIIIVPIVLIFGLPYYLIWGQQISLQAIRTLFDGTLSSSLYLFAILPIIIIGTVAHEFIHGIFWAKYAKSGFKSIKFGVFWKMLTPYCHCKEPLLVKHYIIGATMPAIILGIIPAIAAICTGNFALLVFGIFFTVAAGGDFLIIIKLLKENKNDLVQDHPSEAGFYIYRKVIN